jgi:rod shape-determining protein MreD
MIKLSKITFLNKILTAGPILILFISVLNEFDLNYLELKYFSFNFPFILIFYWSLKKSENLGYGLIFLAGLINDVVIGYPLGMSSLSYLLICGFAAYFRNITLHPSVLKDWLYFLFTILVISSLLYSVLALFFSYNLDYSDLLVNLLFTFLFYVIFANLFSIYEKLVFDRTTND